MFSVSAFLFYFGIVFGMFFVCYCFVFVLILVLLSDYEKNTVFPTILVLFEPCWLEGSLLLCFMCLSVFLFIFLWEP